MMNGQLPLDDSSKPDSPALPAAPAANPDAAEESELALGRELARVLDDVADLGEAVGRCFRTLRSFMNFDAGAVRLCREGQEWVWMTSGAPLAIEAVHQLIDATASCLGETGRHVDCALGPLDVSTDETGRAPRRALASIACSMLFEPGMEGCVAVAADRPFDDGERRLVTIFAARVGPAFRRIGALDDALLARLRAVVEMFDEGIAVARDNLSVQPLNASADGILSALTGDRRPARRLPRKEALARSVLDALAHGEPGEAQVVVAGKDGPRTLRALTRRIGPHEALLIFQDRSRELVLLERMLQSEKMASIGKLVSGVAHELNNPLTAVTGFAQMLLTRGFDERTRRELRTILEEAERASSIVQNLLAYARQRPPEKTPVRINEMIERVLALRSYDFRIAGIDVDLDLDPDVPTILADPDQLQQVLFNVITNAEQAIQGAGTGSGTIWVTSRLEGDRLRIAVDDSGPGIHPEHLFRIFDPFFTTKPVGEGTGLGLSMCYGMVKAHGGRISVENRAGAGASFTIELPIEIERQPEEELGPRPERTGARILVIDDEASIRALVSGVLAMADYDVEVAESVSEALELLDRTRFDAIIADTRMPGLEGPALYQALRQRHPELAEHIGFMTGDAGGDTAGDFLQASGRPYAEKPLRMDRIRELAAAIVGG